MPKEVKRVVAVLATSTSMIKKKTEEDLKQIPCIWYPVIFKNQTEALLDSTTKVNAMSQAFIQQLSLKICKTNVRAQKINGTILETYEMVVSTFYVLDKDGRRRFFEENFLLADVKPDLVLKILFLTMNNTNVDFQVRNL